jgi:hypothetical protein
MTMRRRTTPGTERDAEAAQDAFIPVPTLPGRLIGAVLMAEEATLAAQLRAERAEAHGIWSDYVIALDDRWWRTFSPTSAPMRAK